MNNIFWDLTDSEILQGMTIMYDKNLQNKKPEPPMLMFAYDKKLQRMAEMLRDCNFDRTLMKLTYSEEINDLENQNTNTWFAVAGLNRGIII